MNFVISIDKAGNITEREGRIASADISDLGYGGMIVLSTDVNIGGSGLKGKIKNLARTFVQRWFKDKLVDEEISKYIKEKKIETGWSIGNLFKGRYYSPKIDATFNEKSFSIDIRGAEFDFVKEVAKKIGKRFKQESVLIINHETGKSSLLFP